MAKVIRVNQIKFEPQNEYDIVSKLYKILGLNKSYNIEYEIIKKSIDSRKKPNIFYAFSVDIAAISSNGKALSLEKVLKSIDSNMVKKHNIVITDKLKYEFPDINNIKHGKLEENLKPVVIGFGPAGMFAMLKLCEAGLEPICYERGGSVDERKLSVNRFWLTGELDTESNVQFGEGGAGTFSDGKLNTVIKDSTGRIREVLETLVKFGASSDILYNNKPHIGTDVLSEVVKNIREYIISKGGKVYFNTKLEDIIVNDGKINSIIVKNNISGVRKEVPCENICLAIGHSSRDTFDKIYSKGCIVEPKAFAVGLRIQHPQQLIDNNAYGDNKYKLPAADYKITNQTSKGRGVYSFCMCPGGWVVNASSEKNMLCVNGMSYSKRDSANANSALIVTVTPEDFGNNALDGIAFQRKLEKKAFDNGKGKVPVQLLADFKINAVSKGFGRVKPCIKGEYEFADLNNIFPEIISESIKESMSEFDRKIKGFDMEDAILAGVESRTSSPVRIVRDELLEANIKGLFPCGEGAGYAGGITSAAVDGIKVAERIACKIDDIFR